MTTAQDTPGKYVKRCTHSDKHEGRYLFLEEKRDVLTARRMQNCRWYSTNQSNQQYVPYYNLRYTAFKTTLPTHLPPHPRERHRCDYHMTDFIASVTDGKASRYGTFLQLLRCVQSDVGQEPERLRDEYWIDQ